MMKPWLSKLVAFVRTRHLDDELDEDIWYNYTATCDGTLTVGTCNDRNPQTGDATFDTKIAVYEGCDTGSCPLGGNEIGCNDDHAGCANFSSTVTATVVSGTCYTIRIGAFAASTRGSGNVSVSCAP